MLNRIHKNIFNKAQSFSEYAMLLTLIVIIFTAMQFFTKRSIQSVVKYSADQIALQRDAAEDDPLKGYTVGARTPTQQGKAFDFKDYTYRVEEERTLLGNPKITYEYNEETRIPDGEEATGVYFLGAEEKND